LPSVRVAVFEAADVVARLGVMTGELEEEEDKLGVHDRPSISAANFEVFCYYSCIFICYYYEGTFSRYKEAQRLLYLSCWVQFGE
jgi:hypothetical protein